MMRILIVTHAPLTSEFGASQLAINLSEALRAQGHDVTLWSPSPLPEGIRWWRTIPAMRAKLDEFLKTQEAFDVIDSPAALVTRLTARSSAVLVRSTQPDLLYLKSDLNVSRVRNIRSVIRLPFELAHLLYHALRVLRGWQLAQGIMCLGTLELRWMRSRFPWWRGKLTSYFSAISDEDQLALAEVARKRNRRPLDRLRFIWIGRWTAHKGTDLLLAFVTRWTAVRPQDTFTIAGCGADAAKYCPAELLKSGVIKILPSYQRSHLAYLLSEHDVGLFTSRVEGWGLSLNEMLEAGMPVFATEAGGTKDLARFVGNELQVFPPSLPNILNALMAPTSFENYYQEFSWKQIAEKYSHYISAELQLEKAKQRVTLQSNAAVQ